MYGYLVILKVKPLQLLKLRLLRQRLPQGREKDRTRPTRAGSVLSGWNQAWERRALRVSSWLATRSTSPRMELSIFRRRSVAEISAFWAAQLTVTVAVLVSLWQRTPLKVDVIRDRGSLARLVEQGRIENVYRLQIMNATESTQRYVISVSGLPGIAIASDTEIEVLPTEARSAAVRVQIPPDAAVTGSHTIHFDVRSQGIDGSSVSQVSEKAAFLVPR